MRYAKLTASALLGISSFLALNASAEIIMTDPVTTPYQQTTNSPCIFGGETCKSQNPAGFDYKPVPSSASDPSYEISSLTYTVEQIINLVGTTFLIGIDINTTAKPATERLVYFKMNINGILSETNSFSPETDYQFLGINNGNGFADATLGIFDLTGLEKTATITFDLSMKNTTDGDETFFLIRADGGGTGNNVPEPGTIAILGLGLLGMGFAAKRGRGKQA